MYRGNLHYFNRAACGLATPEFVDQHSAHRVHIEVVIQFKAFPKGAGVLRG